MAAPVRKRPFLLRLVFLAVSIKKSAKWIHFIWQKKCIYLADKMNNSIGTDEQEYCDKTLKKTNAITNRSVDEGSYYQPQTETLKKN